MQESHVRFVVDGLEGYNSYVSISITEDAMVALEWLKDLFLSIWAIREVRFTVYHILLNFVVALAAAVRTNTFEFAKVGEFLYRKLLPFLMVFAASAAASEALSVQWLVTITWGLVELSLTGDMVGNLKTLGIPIPDKIVELFEREE